MRKHRDLGQVPRRDRWLRDSRRVRRIAGGPDFGHGHHIVDRDVRQYRCAVRFERQHVIGAEHALQNHVARVDAADLVVGQARRREQRVIARVDRGFRTDPD